MENKITIYIHILLTETIMHYKNYLATMLLTFLVGSIFTPSIGMEIEQQQNQDQFERVKLLVDAFCITRIRIQGAELNGFEYYKKLTDQDSYSHQSAIKELQGHYNQQNFEMKRNSMPTSIFKKLLYAQTLSNQGTYSYGPDGQKKLVKEMIDTLVNREKIERSIAKIAILDKLQSLYFPNENENLFSERVYTNPVQAVPVDILHMPVEIMDLIDPFTGERTSRAVFQYEDDMAQRIERILRARIRERILVEEHDVHFEDSLLTRLRNYVSDHPLIGIGGVTTLVLSPFLYRWFK